MNRYIVNTQRRRWDYLRDVVTVLVARDFKLRYKGSAFGVAWSLVVPLAQFAVLDIVFKSIVPLNIPHFTTFLFAGFLPWTWLQSSLLVSALAVVDNREFVKQAGFPVALLPTITVLSQSIHFVLAMPIVAYFMIGDGCHASPALAFMPAVVIVQLVLILGLSYIVATLQVRFRDTQYLLGVLLFVFFYLTPVFWSDKGIPEPYHTIMMWNPVAIVVNAYRAILIDGQLPEAVPLLTVAIGSAALLAFSYSFFAVSRDRFVEEI